MRLICAIQFFKNLKPAEKQNFAKVVKTFLILFKGINVVFVCVLFKCA